MDYRQSLHNRLHHHDIGNKTPKIEFIPTSVWNRHWLFALTYLMQIPLDVLKIAKSFIDDVSNLQDDRERLPPLLLMGIFWALNCWRKRLSRCYEIKRLMFYAVLHNSLRDFYHEDTKKKPK
jgi:hypothetical protein